MDPQVETKDRFRAFIEQHALYQKLRFDVLFGSAYERLKKERTNVRDPEAPLPLYMVIPSVASLHCSVCGCTRTYDRSFSERGRTIGDAASVPSTPPPASIPPTPSAHSVIHAPPDRSDEVVPILASEKHFLGMRCTHCRKSRFWCWIEVDGEGEWMRKVGQVPPWDISIEQELTAALGDDAALYKRALVNMSQSFGVGACAYMRRVLENRISPLLQMAYEIRKQDGASMEELERCRNIIKGKVAEKKIRLANTVLPESITVEGENVLELIHDRLSEGIHRRDEQDCVEIAQAARDPLEIVFKQLQAEARLRKSKGSFRTAINALRRTK